MQILFNPILIGGSLNGFFNNFVRGNSMTMKLLEFLLLLIVQLVRSFIEIF